MSTEAQLCLFGAGGHGRVVACQLARISGRTVVFGDAHLKGQAVAGYPVLYDSVEAIDTGQIIITIGNNALRRRLQEAAGGRVAPAIVIDPQKVYSDAIGAGSQIMAGAVVNADTRIGKGVIVNSNAVVEHDCDIGDFCHVAPGAILGGGARLGDDVIIGSGAVVLPGVSVTAKAVVGAGAVVARDILELGCWVGVPAKRLLEDER